MVHQEAGPIGHVPRQFRRNRIRQRLTNFRPLERIVVQHHDRVVSYPNFRCDAPDVLGLGTPVDAQSGEIGLPQNHIRTPQGFERGGFLVLARNRQQRASFGKRLETTLDGQERFIQADAAFTRRTGPQRIIEIAHQDAHCSPLTGGKHSRDTGSPTIHQRLAKWHASQKPILAGIAVPAAGFEHQVRQRNQLRVGQQTRQRLEFPVERLRKPGSGVLVRERFRDRPHTRADRYEVIDEEAAGHRGTRCPDTAGISLETGFRVVTISGQVLEPLGKNQAVRRIRSQRRRRIRKLQRVLSNRRRGHLQRMPNRIPIRLAQIARHQIPVGAAENAHSSLRTLLAGGGGDRGSRNPNIARIAFKHHIAQLSEGRTVPAKFVTSPSEALPDESCLTLPRVGEPGSIMQQQNRRVGLQRFAEKLVQPKMLERIRDGSDFDRDPHRQQIRTGLPARPRIESPVGR